MFTENTGGIPNIVTSGGHDGAGSNWIWAIVLIVFVVLLGGGGGLFGNRGDNVSPATGAAFTELNGRMDALSQQVNHVNDVNDLRDLKSTQASLGLQIAGNRTDTLLNFKDLSLQLANCCCDTRTAIADVRFQNAQDTCAIINANNANTQRIIDEMRVTERDRLRDEVANLRLANSQARQDFFIERQSDRVIGALTPPCPVPAYPSWPASQPINPFAYNGYPGHAGHCCP